MTKINRRSRFIVKQDKTGHYWGGCGWTPSKDNAVRYISPEMARAIMRRKFGNVRGMVIVQIEKPILRARNGR